MYARLPLFRTTSTKHAECLRLEGTPFRITISSHVHVFYPLQASSTASSTTNWRRRCGFSRGAVTLKIVILRGAHS